jgi:pimeloyl-ACP methyl ester carboxylesterase
MKLAQKLAVNYYRAKINILGVVSKRKAAKKAFDLFCTPLRKPKKQTPPVFEKAEKLSFEFETHRIVGYRWNHPQEKKVLIVHGFESTAKNFDRYIMPLVKNGYEVLAFDAPAHGKSGGKRINLPMYARTIQRICEFYGPVNSFIAHSFGGLALAHYLETLPETQPIKAVMIAPATETTSAIDSFFQFLQLSPEIRVEFDKLIQEIGGVRPDHYSIRRAMHHITGDILWFHDEDDDMTPLADALKVQEDAHAHIEFVITKGLGHRRIYRDNKVFKRTIEFLELAN